MPASTKQRSKSSLRQQIAWEMFTNGVDQWKIAEELGLSEGTVSGYIKKAAANNPITKLSYEERAALSEAKWNQGEADIREEIKLQREQGRITQEVIKFPDGSEQVKVTKTSGVDPALLRALSTHTDRRNRQGQNQLAPDTNVQQVNVSVVKDFLNQSDNPAGRLSPQEWNERQGAVDV